MKLRSLLFLCLPLTGFAQTQPSYTEENVSYWNTKDSVQLHGTLSLPKTGKSFPAVILITGSGPQDRDETLLGHKPFKVIADYLSSRGFAVLRYDDRGGGTANDIYRKATIEHFAKDAEAGLDFLKTRKEINGKKIGFLGHSEGGSVAPMVASERKDVAFLVLMAAPGRPHAALMAQQNRDILKGMKVDSALVDVYTKEFYEEVFPKFATMKDTAQMRSLVRNRIAVLRTKMTPNQLFQFGIPPKEDVFVNAVIQSSNTDWFRHFIAFNPEVYLQRVKVPTLAVNGAKDVQVNADLNLGGIEENLKKAGNTNVKLVKLPGLNHLMQTATTGMPQEYAKIKEDLSPVFLETVYDWLKSFK